MQIPSVQSIQAVKTATAGNMLSNLKPGQVLQAKLIGMDGDGAAQLKLSGGNMLRTMLPQKLPVGSQLQLRVEANQQNALSLKLLPQQSADSGGKAMAAQVRGGKPSLPSTPLPLTETKSDQQQTTADRGTLSNALRAFAEAGKALGNLPAQQQGNPALDDISLKLPLIINNQPQQAEIHISREDQADNEKARDGWQLRFNMDFSQIGPVETRMRLQGERLDITLWAENPQVAEDLRTHVEELRDDLAARNIAVGALAVYEGEPGGALGASGKLIGG